MQRYRKILVVGGSGQLGQALLQELPVIADEVVGTYAHQCPPGLKHSLRHLDLTNQAKVAANQAQAAELLAALRPEVVINTAALTHVDECERSPEKAHALNVEGNRALSHYCGELGAKLVLISTYYVFDGKKPAQGDAYTETDIPNPLNVYAKTKLEAEKDTLRNGANLVLRTSKIYSYGLEQRNFLARLLSSLRAGIPFPLTCDQFTNPLSAQDLAKAIVKLLSCGASGIYHAGGPDRASNYDFALRAAKILALERGLIRPLATEESAEMAKRPKECVLDTGKLMAATGFRARGIQENLSAIKI